MLIKLFQKMFSNLRIEQGVCKLTLSICFVGILIFPFLQYSLGILPRVSLVDTPMRKNFPHFSLPALSHAKFQEQMEEWLMHNNGLFGWMIKTSNTINYRLFDLGSSRYTARTLVGKDKALFDNIYINDFNGKYITKLPNPDLHAQEIKNLQTAMENKGKTFLLVVHPNKARFNPQWVKDSQKVGSPENSYLSKLRPFLDQYKINYLVIGDHFQPNIQYFVKSGAHLNSYAKCISAKLINDRLQSLMPSANLPKFECTLTGKQVAPLGEDLDLANLLNVWDYTPSLEAVPDFKLEIQDLPKNKLKAMYVGTSYCMGVLDLLDELHAYRAVDFLFYKRTLYYSRKKYTKDVRKGQSAFSSKLHTPKFITNHDLLVLESTDARLHQLGFGLLDSFKKN